LIEVTPQEQQLINSLVERVNQTQLQEKDPDAEALLTQGLSSNRDALYILAQSVLIQNFALDQAKAQVEQLQQQLQQARQPAHATSFLGNLLGHRDPAPPPYTPVQPTYVPPPPLPPAYADPQYGQPQYVPAGQPSFLRGAMQTAAGVAAGALAFEGVESLLHGGFGHPGFGMEPGMGMMGGGGGFGRPEETVINNYYDQPGGQEHHSEEGSFNQGDQDQHFHETSDRDGAQFSDASYNTSGNDQGNLDDNVGFDDANVDDNIAQDDSSGFDDGGGFDSGGGDFS
jgi:hypothetical protein